MQPESRVGVVEPLEVLGESRTSGLPVPHIAGSQSIAHPGAARGVRKCRPGLLLVRRHEPLQMPRHRQLRKSIVRCASGMIEGVGRAGGVVCTRINAREQQQVFGGIVSPGERHCRAMVRQINATDPQGELATGTQRRAAIGPGRDRLIEACHDFHERLRVGLFHGEHRQYVGRPAIAGMHFENLDDGSDRTLRPRVSRNHQRARMALGLDGVEERASAAECEPLVGSIGGVRGVRLLAFGGVEILRIHRAAKRAEGAQVGDDHRIGAGPIHCREILRRQRLGQHGKREQYHCSNLMNRLEEPYASACLDVHHGPRPERAAVAAAAGSTNRPSLSLDRRQPPRAVPGYWSSTPAG